MGEKLDELSGAKINVINTNLKSLQLMKQSDDISGEVEDEKNVDIISRLIYYGAETLCL